MKPYVCSECSKSFFTPSNMKQHQLKHSDFRQFCCGSCGKYFKHKNYVVSHFNKCSVKLGYVHIFARQDWDREQTICGQCCLLDRVTAVDSRLVSEIHTQIQTAATRCVFEHPTFFIQWTASYRQCFDAVWLLCVAYVGLHRVNFQGVHFSGKQGNIGGFYNCQGNVSNFSKNWRNVVEKVLSENCLNTFWKLC